MEAAVPRHAYIYSARDRASDVCGREHGIVATVGTIKVHVQSVCQSYTLHAIDHEDDEGKLGPVALRDPGSVPDLLHHTKTRARRQGRIRLNRAQSHSFLDEP